MTSLSGEGASRIYIKPVSAALRAFPTFSGALLIDSDVETSRGVGARDDRVLTNPEGTHIEIPAFKGEAGDTALASGGALLLEIASAVKKLLE